MNKVLYNECYGGYRLSQALQKEYWDNRGVSYTIDNSNEWTPSIIGENGEPLHLPSSRHDKEVIALVEAYKARGLNPSGSHANIQIEEIKGNQYMIEEYDGMETVVEPNDMEWTTI